MSSDDAATAREAAKYRKLISKFIVDELTRRDPDLLAALCGTQEPTTDQREAVKRVLALAVIKSFGPDWVPDEHGLAVERAIEAFLEAWPIYRYR
jgi:hypothetical protein